MRSRRLSNLTAVVAAIGLASPVAFADEESGVAVAPATTAAVESSPSGRWGVGIQMGFHSAPAGNLGLPLDDIAGIPYDQPTEIVVRREIGERTALDAGFGLPHEALGFTGWVGFEMFLPVVANAICALEVYADPAIQVGYAGPDYYARRHHVFVGYEYGATGAIALAVRSPIGLRVRWPGARLDTYIEAAPLVTFTPAIEPFYITIVGARFRL